MKLHLFFTLFVSILTVFIGLYFNWSFYIGEGAIAPNKTEALASTLIFLLIYLAYGMVMGYKKRKDFIKFITLYWGLSGAMGIMLHFMLPFRGNSLKRAYAVIALPVLALTSFPTFGLKYFYPFTMDSDTVRLVQIIVSMLSSWSAGALGYILGYQIKRLRFKNS